MNTLYSILSFFRAKEIIKQIYLVANQSLFVVVFCTAFASLVLIMEFSFHIRWLTSDDFLVPGFASLFILREMGASLPALLMTFKIGAGWTAEIGLMKMTQQIDALQVLNINSFKLLVIPKLIACIIGGMLLSLVASIVCLFVVVLFSVQRLDHSFASVLQMMQDFLQLKDFIFSMMRGGLFGVVIPLVSCYFGFVCKPGAKGIGIATTHSIVTSSLLILILDL